MGILRFRVAKRQRLAADAGERAYMTGLDEVPWVSTVRLTDTGLTVRRAEDDSGSLHVPWQVPDRGELMLCTAVLMERDDDEPYFLDIELARGLVHRLRIQMWAWQAAGVVIPAAVQAGLAKVISVLARACTSRQDPDAASELAQRVIIDGLALIDAASPAYAEHIATVRSRISPRSTTVLGVNLGGWFPRDAAGAALAAAIVPSVSAVVVPLAWRTIEAKQGSPDWTLADRQVDWCRSVGLKVCGGPLLDLSPTSMPDWMYLWEGENENINDFLTEHITAVVNRYRGRVHIWQCAARMNTVDVLSMKEEDRLRLCALAIQTTRAADPKAPIVLRVDQPFAEFTAREACELSPLHFADTLIRAELGLSGLMLEVNLGYHPGGTQPRDLLDFSRHFDRWASLGLPLLITLTLPSSAEPDARARVKAAVKPYAADTVTPDSQRRWIEQSLPMLLSKPSVQGIFFNQLFDSEPHEFPHAGLFDNANRAKPALAALREIRKRFIP